MLKMVELDLEIILMYDNNVFCTITYEYLLHN